MKKPQNLRDLSVEVTKLEGKKKSLSVAQVAEVIKCLRKLLKKHPVAVMKLLLK